MAQSTGINLLPDQGSANVNSWSHNRLLFAVPAIVIVATLLITIGVVSYHFYLSQLNSIYLSDITADSNKLVQYQSTEVLYRNVDSKLTMLQSLINSYPYDSVVLDDVSSFTPSGIKLTSLTFDNTGKLEITAQAQNPDQFGQFVNILKDPQQGGKKFANVDVSALTGGGDTGTYTFTLTMTHAVVTPATKGTGQ